LAGNANILYALVPDSTSTKSKIYASPDEGSTWNRGVTADYGIYGTPELYEGRLIYLSSTVPGGYRTDILIMFSIEKNKFEVIKLPAIFDCYFLHTDGSSLRLLGLQDGKITCYSVHKKEISLLYSYTTDHRVFPQGYFFSGSHDVIVVGQRTDQSVTNKLLKTDDSGQHWTAVDFVKKDYIKPFIFVKTREDPWVGSIQGRENSKNLNSVWFGLVLKPMEGKNVNHLSILL
jgi:hypothetical protein